VEKTLFHGKIMTASSKIAAALSSKGLGPNSKAGLYLNNSNEYLIGQNAIFKIGGTSN